MRSAADSREQRGNLLAILFPVLISSFILFFLFLICGGFSLYLLAVVAGLALLGSLHYFLWGHAFTKQAAGEREESAGKEQLEHEDWTPEERAWFQRF
jgi:hypothetical protein